MLRDAPPAAGPSSLVGTTVGHIRVSEILGKGGMGEVYAGFDEKLRRKVALKAIRGEARLDARAKRRLLREAQALSLLDHPHICRIFDLVEGKEADLLVLEFIEGKTLKRAIADGMTNSERMRIALEVANALIAAHSKGIVHRDLKPDNVMLTPGGAVKVLDFGLACAVSVEPLPEGPPAQDEPTRGLDDAPLPEEDSGPDAADLSLPGTVLGTPGYMSPEQARGEHLSAASDMYAFGLLLQEIFSGLPAVDPALPFVQKIQMAARGESEAAQGLDAEMALLVARLKSRRPETRPTAVDTEERLRWMSEKPLRRRRRLLTALAMAGLAAVAIVMTALAIRIRQEERRANREAHTAKQVSKFLTGLFEVSDPGEARGNSVTARELLDKGAQKVKEELEGEPVVQARMMDTMGEVYTKLGLFDRARPLLKAALDLRERNLGPAHPDVASSLSHLALLDWYTGDLESAEKCFRRALDVQRAQLGEESEEVADTLNRLAGVEWSQGEAGEAEKLCERSLSIREKVFGADDPEVAKSLTNLAILCDMEQKYDKAETLLWRALSIYEKRYEENHPQVAVTLNNLGALYDAQNKDSQAEPVYRRALAIQEKVLGPDHPDVATTLSNLGDTLRSLTRHGDAEPLYRRALSIWEAKLGPGHPDLAYALSGLAECLANRREYDKAEALYRRALAIRREGLGKDHEETKAALEAYVSMLRSAGRAAEAERLERESRN